MAFHISEYKYLEKLDGKNVLELGCGRGHTVAELSKRFEKIFGIDPDVYLLLDELAKEQFASADNFYPIGGSGESLPFADEIFNGVISHWSLHHYRYPLTILHEIRRVLRCDGWLYLADGVDYPYDKMSPQQRNHQNFHKFAVAADRFRKRDHYPLRTPENLAKIIERAGFEITGIKIVSDEDPSDPRREPEYVRGYIENLSALRERMFELAAPQKLADDLSKLIASIERDGIRIAPFAIIIAKNRHKLS